MQRPRQLALLFAFAVLSCSTPEVSPEPSTDSGVEDSELVEPTVETATAGEIVSAPEPLEEEPAWRRASGTAERFDVAWRPVEGDVPRNEHFKIEVEVFKDDVRYAVTRLGVRGWMPDHAHGFVQQPLITDLGEGRFLVEGLLFHMRGFWNLIFDVRDEASEDVVEFDITIR